jgi:hypothetical protein
MFWKPSDSMLPPQLQCGILEKASVPSGSSVPAVVRLKRCPVEPSTSCRQKGDVDEGIVKFLGGETDGVLARTKKLDLEGEPYQYEQV